VTAPTLTYCIKSCPSANGTADAFTKGSISVETSTIYWTNFCVPDNELSEAVASLTNGNSEISGLVNDIPKFGPYLPIFVCISIILTLC